MKKIFAVIMCIPFVAFGQMGTSITTSTTMRAMDPMMQQAQEQALRAEIQRIEAENKSLEAENAALEAEIAKLKKKVGLFQAGTAIGVAGTGVGTFLWIKNAKAKKTSKARFDLLTELETKVNAHTGPLPIECQSLGTTSTDAEIQTCISKL
ncbi:MAG: hypothetical protein JXR30_01480 [Alphaproteobacteria bacterium]|nr:hypothetical protein [Alphaproteobacteria bacterium]